MESQIIDDISVFNPTGELGPVDGEILLKKIQKNISSDWKKIVLDLGGVDHIHYRFLSELLSLAATSSGLEGGIKLANVNPYTRSILRLAGVERFFETYDSVAEAVLSFENLFTQTYVQ